MNVGSLFSGIGGMDCGLARAGHRHLFFCESDEWRRAVLAARWPGVPIYDDVRLGLQHLGHGSSPGRNVAAAAQEHERAGDGLGAGGVRGDLGLLCGGFPCQDLSVAGKRAGLAGVRSGLFHEFARIIDAVRPRYVLIENVPGLLTSNGGRDFGVVLGTLADFGYGMGWRVLDSRFFGVPQRRRRVFVVGALADGDPAAAARRAGEILAVGSRCDRHPATSGKTRQESAVASLSGLGSGGPDDNDGQANRVIVANTMKAQRGKGGGGIGPEETLAVAAGVRRLTPIECERLQGLPDGWTQLDAKTPDSRRYSGLGDAVTATVAEWIGRRLT